MFLIMVGSFIPKTIHQLKHPPWAGEETDLNFLLPSYF